MSGWEETCYRDGHPDVFQREVIATKRERKCHPGHTLKFSRDGSFSGHSTHSHDKNHYLLTKEGLITLFYPLFRCYLQNKPNDGPWPPPILNGDPFLAEFSEVTLVPPQLETWSAAKTIAWTIGGHHISKLRFLKNRGTPKSSILDWDFPWNKPSIFSTTPFQETSKWFVPCGHGLKLRRWKGPLAMWAKKSRRHWTVGVVSAKRVRWSSSVCKRNNLVVSYVVCFATWDDDDDDYYYYCYYYYYYYYCYFRIFYYCCYFWLHLNTLENSWINLSTAEYIWLFVWNYWGHQSDHVSRMIQNLWCQDLNQKYRCWIYDPHHFATAPRTANATRSCTSSISTGCCSWWGILPLVGDEVGRVSLPVIPWLRASTSWALEGAGGHWSRSPFQSWPKMLYWWGDTWWTWQIRRLKPIASWNAKPWMLGEQSCCQALFWVLLRLKWNSPPLFLLQR